MELMWVLSPCVFLRSFCCNLVTGDICTCKFRINFLIFFLINPSSRGNRPVGHCLFWYCTIPVFLPSSHHQIPSQRGHEEASWNKSDSGGLSSSQWAGFCLFVVYLWCQWNTEDRKSRSIHLSNLGYICHDVALQSSGIIPRDEFGPLTFPEWTASSKVVLALRSCWEN